MIGQTLSHFKITAKLGEGGMGEVYRAEDTRLGREVAIKVLPEAFTHEPERLARFEREARVLASLSHPAIATLHEVGQTEGEQGEIHFLVMEIAEGTDLKQRIARGAMPLEEALPIALQITQALEAAHGQGIIHRDLKPANVVVSDKGSVKVLDFGLAKAWAPESGSGSGSELTRSPTLTAQMTQVGSLLGTAAYMSPEQARGQEVDKRADIWAFGCLLLEMLTGDSPFQGQTVTDIFAAIVTREPEWGKLPQRTPAGVRRVLERCLEKEADNRLHDIADARVEIDHALQAGLPETAEVAKVEGASGRLRIWQGTAAAAALASIAMAALLLRPSPAPTRVTRATILAPEGTDFDFTWGTPGVVAVSPDGRRLAFAAKDEDGDEALYVRDLEDREARALPGTGNVAYPFWSPDGRFLAFFSEGKLKKIEVAGGPPITLTDAANGKGGTWNEAGDILFAPSAASPLFRVAAAGGEARQVTGLDEGVNEHRYPQFLPGGERFLYLDRTLRSNDGRLMIGSLAGDAPVDLFASATGGRYAAGHLFFLVENTLMARPFDPDSLEVTGDLFPVAEDVVSGANLIPAFSISDGGTLAYHGGAVASGATLQWIDRAGLKGPVVGEPDKYVEIRLSPDGRRAVAGIVNAESGMQDLWILDLERGLRERFTFAEETDWLPTWSQDGERIAYVSNRGEGTGQIYVKSVLTGEDARVLFEDEHDKYLFDWSPDDRYLTYNVLSAETSYDMYTYDLVEGGEPIAIQHTPFFDAHPVISPDGRWLAYFTSASGQSEIFVTSFPGGGRKWQVSTEGGGWPLWDPSGERLYWLGNKTIAAAEVDGSGSIFRVGDISEFGLDRSITTSGPYPYDISADGQRFLVVLPPQETFPPLSLVLDFPALLRTNR